MEVRSYMDHIHGSYFPAIQNSARAIIKVFPPFVSKLNARARSGRAPAVLCKTATGNSFYFPFQKFGGVL